MAVCQSGLSDLNALRSVATASRATINASLQAARAELRTLTAKTGKHVALLVRCDDAPLFVPLGLS
jgi:hypothetical protein